MTEPEIEIEIDDLAIPAEGDDAGGSTRSDAVLDALTDFTACIDSSLEDLCSFGLTIGDSYAPFQPDEDDEHECEEDAQCLSQGWVRVDNVGITASKAWDETCGAQIEFRIEVGVLRCIEIPEGGEAPTASDVFVAAAQAMDDMLAIQCSAMGCEDIWTSIRAEGWTPVGPLGGQSGGIWMFFVTL